MPTMLVLCQSGHTNTAATAQAAVEGAREAGIDVTVKLAPGLAPVDAWPLPTTVASAEEVPTFDAIVLVGTGPRGDGSGPQAEFQAMLDDFYDDGQFARTVGAVFRAPDDDPPPTAGDLAAIRDHTRKVADAALAS